MRKARGIYSFVGECVLSAGHVLKFPRLFRWRDCLSEMQACGAMALPIVSLISFLVGITLAYTGAIVLRQYGGDIYVADGYGNRRVVVFDKSGKYLRQWGREGTPEEAEAGVGGVFSHYVHCVHMSRSGLLYVCERSGDRVEVFDKMGKFVRNIWIRTGTPKLPDPRGTVWDLEFSRDPQQKYVYVMNGRSEVVTVVENESGKILGTFGRPGHQAGNFTHGHTIAMDSKGNLYIAETDIGRRVQKFRPVN